MTRARRGFDESKVKRVGGRFASKGASAPAKKAPAPQQSGASKPPPGLAQKSVAVSAKKKAGLVSRAVEMLKRAYHRGFTRTQDDLDTDRNDKILREAEKRGIKGAKFGDQMRGLKSHERAEYFEEMEAKLRAHDKKKQIADEEAEERRKAGKPAAPAQSHAPTPPTPKNAPPPKPAKPANTPPAGVPITPPKGLGGVVTRAGARARGPGGRFVSNKQP